MSLIVNGVAATITIPVSRYKDEYWGILCLRSGTNFELEISRTFECILEDAEMLRQVARQ